MKKEILLKIHGISCQACVNRIEKVLRRNKNIIEANVNYASETAKVTYEYTKDFNKNNIISLIDKIGYKAKEKDDFFDKDNTDKLSWRLVIIFSITFLFLINMVGMFLHIDYLMIPVRVQFMLATIVQIFAWPFYKNAFVSMKDGVANMDLLVIFGTTSIWVYSIYLLFFSNQGYVYFEGSVMVIGFVSFGKYLETKAKHKGLNFIDNMLKLTPKIILVYRNNAWVETNFNDIKIGDLVRTRIGERVCADGIIKTGDVWVDESHLTGESEILHKTQNDKILAGAFIENGNATFVVNSLGKDTILGDMIAALDEAQGTKAQIARIADKVATIFIPLVLLIAIITFSIVLVFTKNFQLALMNSVAILVVACPCALGLATPAAIMAGIALGSKYGILFKDATILEKMAKVDTLVFDKTGTLTIGSPKINDIYINKDSKISTDKLIQIAASIEQNSIHPLAKSFISLARNKNINLFEVKNISTSTTGGIEGFIEDTGNVKIGSLNYCNATLPNNIMSEDLWKISSIVAININDSLVGAFAISDDLRIDSIDVINKLQKQGLNLYIMSGDKQSVVDYIGKKLNIVASNCLGQMLPREKADKVKELVLSNKNVAMIGDGINDAAALANASVSIAFRSGSDIAEQTANITLMNHSISEVYYALIIAKKTLRNIKQNLFFAFCYNTLCIPLAAFGFLNPMLAGLAMSLSSITVLGNALILRYAKIKK